VRLGYLKYFASSVKRDSLIITNLVCFTKLPPWQWTEKSVDSWCQSLVVRKLSVATQRKYLSAIKLFLEYICINNFCRSENKKLAGIISQIDKRNMSNIGMKKLNTSIPTTKGYFPRKVADKIALNDNEGCA
jgi:hypothetical protein